MVVIQLIVIVIYFEFQLIQYYWLQTNYNCLCYE
jgi:hypothetical protein